MRFQSLMGLVAFVALAWAMGENRRRVSVKFILAGLASQLLVGLILLKTPGVQGVFLALNRMALVLEKATRAGTSMVFGYLGGGQLPFKEIAPGASFILAFQALPLVLVISALSALLFYWRVMPAVVRAFAWCLRRILAVGGAEGLAVAANVFVGMVEAPLFIRPYLEKMTRSELFTLMTAGMATIAGTVMVLYATILQNTIDNVMGHILTASIISVPAAVTVAKIMVPETQTPTSGSLELPRTAANSMDAITRGTLQGVELLINIIAMLIVLVALVRLVDLALALLPSVGHAPLSLQRIMGWLMAPLVWLMGIPWDQAFAAGSLMGTKTILNEFLAYLDLGQMDPAALSQRSRLIITYALCGFANPGSLGIMIGGLGTMAPSRRKEIVSLGIRSVIAGTLATSMTGAVVGILMT